MLHTHNLSPHDSAARSPREGARRARGGILRPLAALLAGLLPGLAAPALSAASWEKLAPLPVGNGGFVAAALGGQIAVAGGTTWKGDTKIWLDLIWAYDPQRNTWREAGPLSAPLAYPASGTDGQTLWFASGSSGTTTHLSLWKIDAEFTPRRVAALDRGFVYAAGAIIGSTLYAVGGTDDQAKLDRVTNQLLAVDLRSGVIRRLPDYPEAGLTTGTAAAVGNHLFVFGGARWDHARQTVINHAAAHVYSVAQRRWEPVPTLPYPGRGYTAVALDDRHILLAGGYRDDAAQFVADAWIYELEAHRYRATTALPYAAMVSLVKSGEWLYCLGGEDRKKHRTDAVFRIRCADLLAAPR